MIKLLKLIFPFLFAKEFVFDPAIKAKIEEVFTLNMLTKIQEEYVNHEVLGLCNVLDFCLLWKSFDTRYAICELADIFLFQRILSKANSFLRDGYGSRNYLFVAKRQKHDQRSLRENRQIRIAFLEWMIKHLEDTSQVAPDSHQP